MNGILIRVHKLMPGLLRTAAFTFAALAFLAALGAAAFTFATLAFATLGAAAFTFTAFTFAALAFLAALGAAAFTFAALAFVGAGDLHVTAVQLRHGKRVAAIGRGIGNVAGSQTGSKRGTNSQRKRGFGFVSHWIISCCG
jgi:hypothetical protein